MLLQDHQGEVVVMAYCHVLFRCNGYHEAELESCEEGV